MISLNLVLAGLRLGLKNRQVGEKWVSDDCSYLCKGLSIKNRHIFCEVLAGCVCSDDVSQAINDENGYCKLQVKLDKDTNKLEITL